MLRLANFIENENQNRPSESTIKIVVKRFQRNCSMEHQRAKNLVVVIIHKKNVVKEVKIFH